MGHGQLDGMSRMDGQYLGSGMDVDMDSWTACRGWMDGHGQLDGLSRMDGLTWTAGRDVEDEAFNLLVSILQISLGSSSDD